MNVNQIPVLNIFGDKQRLEVPLFQRQYVWDKEEQWLPLWEDIQRKFSDSINAVSDTPNHFFGAMVLDQKQTPTGHVAVRQVIDGQQRLTTLQIFLAAFRDFCHENDCRELVNEIDQFLFNKGMMADPEVDRFKVWPTKLDRGQFMDVVGAGSRTELLKRHPTRREKYARQDDSKPRMVEAYFLFFSALKDFFIGTGDEDAVGSEAPLASRLEECLKTLRTSLFVVVIDLNDKDDPQVIFETLNARGQPLLPADLIRNYIFLRVRRDDLDTDQMYKKHWQHFDDEFWRKEINQGRLKRPRSDIFIQHLLSSRQGRDIPIKRLYAEYRHWSENTEDRISVLDEMKLVSQQSQNFRRLLEPDAHDPISPLADVVRIFEVSTVYPLLLRFFEVAPSDEEWKQLARVLESYIVRRTICDLGAKNYNKLFLSASRNLQHHGFSAKNLSVFLKAQIAESTIWPGNRQFQEGWSNNEVYPRLNNRRLVHILGCLNQRYGSNKTERLEFVEHPTIEHIMPKKWLTHWPLMSGQDGFASLDSLPDDHPVVIETRERDRAVHRLGNLTIISQGLNVAESNLGWNEKRPKLIANSILPINLQLHSETVWDENRIAARSQELFQHAQEIWQR